MSMDEIEPSGWECAFGEGLYRDVSVDNSHVALNPDVETSSSVDTRAATEAEVSDDELSGQVVGPIDQQLLHKCDYEAS